MKATGIVRRIDDLGRVVVPKEIRRTLRIREGDPMEIFTDREGEIILKKYSPIGELGLFAQQYADAVHHSTGHVVYICDTDQVIAVSGLPKKELIGLSIHSDLDTLIEKRQTILTKKGDADFVFPTQTFFPDYDFQSEAIATILCEGDAIGAVLIFSLDSQNPLGEPEKAQASTGAYFLGKQLEN